MLTSAVHYDNAAQLPSGVSPGAEAVRNAFAASLPAYHGIPAGPYGGINSDSFIASGLVKSSPGMTSTSSRMDARDYWRSRCNDAGSWKCGGGPVYAYPWRDFAPGVYSMPRPQPYRCPEGFNWNYRQQECVPAGLNGLGAELPCPQYFRFDPDASQCLPAGPSPAGTGFEPDPRPRCPDTWSWAPDRQTCVPLNPPPADTPPVRPPVEVIPGPQTDVTVKTKRRGMDWKTAGIIAGAGVALGGLIAIASRK